VAGELCWDAAALEMSAREVARLAQTGPSGRWDDAIAHAIDEARRWAQPRGRWRRLQSDQDAARMFPGGGTPVAAIAAASEQLWGFAVTIGSALEERVRAAFDAAELLDAVLLDAAGSVACEAACDLLQAAVCPQGTSERYSPGYCHWSVQGQRHMFSLVEPDRVGVELLASMLMRPLKSVTGVVVRASAETLRVPVEVCARCDARGCTRRQAKTTGDG
jgi:hypothetical protein